MFQLFSIIISSSQKYERKATCRIS